MTALLVVLTLVEIALVAVVLVVYLVAIARSLRRTATLLAKVSFGVRAIESQCAPIGPSVTRINEQLTGISAALGQLATLAGHASRTDGTR
ncbi:MAG: hypothetical protein M3P83_11465 [Actinomycetota bacterium]|nr:hypothetical protein [Actinomycetota bacterium]